MIHCTLTEAEGFKCSDQFVITSSLVYGAIRGQATIDLISSTGAVLMSTKTD
jgi:hypothetical protein